MTHSVTSRTRASALIPPDAQRQDTGRISTEDAKNFPVSKATGSSKGDSLTCVHVLREGITADWENFAPRSPPTYDEALHASSSLYLPIGEYAARYQPYSLSYRFIVPPHYDLDDYIEYDSEEADEDEDDWDDEDKDDQERRVATPPLVTLCILVLFVWWASYFV
ncbi:hypothetical protein EV421DRAFT_1776181 [Armillaria borealis]|uniref:Uncharacterized protein n=1 Tax=Armillaria borealis TaxID=47425 RepID=A0AA39JY29_9AGAR|nr:hypothetical protein EV421DRAFT_1776181 [Armillaria borealis]